MQDSEYKMLYSINILIRISITLSCLIFSHTLYAQQKVYAQAKNTLGWNGLEIESVLFKDGERVSNNEFDKRMKTRVDQFKSLHESRIIAAKSKQERFQAECDYLADAKKILAVYLSLYPKLLQQPDAKPIFLQSREYLEHFKIENIQCIE